MKSFYISVADLQTCPLLNLSPSHWDSKTKRCKCKAEYTVGQTKATERGSE